jgi:hypothetical protein
VFGKWLRWVLPLRPYPFSILKASTVAFFCGSVAEAQTERLLLIRFQTKLID